MRLPHPIRDRRRDRRRARRPTAGDVHAEAGVRRIPDHSGWFRADPAEGFRVVDGARSAPAPAPPTVLGGYRWGSTAARSGCEAPDPTPATTDTAWAHPERSTALVPTGGAFLPAPRFERAVLAVAARTEWLAGAVERIESRLDAMRDELVDVATHTDLLELEARRARLAAEVARLSVEMKGELDRRLTELARAVTTAARRSVSIDHRGPLDLADDRRVELHLDRGHAAEIATAAADPRILERRSA